MSRWVTARSRVACAVIESPTPGLHQPRERLLGSEPERSQVDLHEVRLDLLEVDRDAGRVEPLGEPPRALVVLGQPLDVVLERVDARGRDDPRLPHRAAELVLEPRAPSPSARTSRRRSRRAGSRGPSRGRA